MVMDNELSDYEKLRLEKIKRNERRLEELGLGGASPFLRVARKAKKKKFEKTAVVPGTYAAAPRRSSRKRKTANYREAVGEGNDTEGEDEEEHEVSESEVDEEEETPVRARKSSRRASRGGDPVTPDKSVGRPEPSAREEPDGLGGLTLERAKRISV